MFDIFARFSPQEISLWESLYGATPILTSAQRALIAADLHACQLIREAEAVALQGGVARAEVMR